MGAFRVAYWDKFGRPAKLPEPTYGIGLAGWWIDPAKEQALLAKTGQTAPDPATAAPAAPAAPAAAESAPADRGSSPLTFILYAGGALVVVLVVVAIMRRKKAT